MKKRLKLLLSLVVICICILGIFLQLKNNKAKTEQTADLANIRGQYYPVKALVIESSNPITKYTATGFLKSNTDLDLISETQGKVVKIFKQKGDYVKKGETIAKVDDELLIAQLNANRAALDQLEKEVARFTKLVKENAVTSQKLEEMQLNLETTKAKYVAAKKQLDNTKIKSPVNGFIESDHIEIGQYLSPGSVVCNIIDTKDLKLELNISEQNYATIKTGQLIEITSSTFPDKTFEGIVTYIGKKAGYGNSFSVEIKLVNNKDNLLKAGMFVSATISSEQNTSGIFVPRKAITGSLKNASIYIIQNNKAILKNVITGGVFNNNVRIIKGIEQGDSVIIEGNYNIYDQASIKVINQQ